MTEKYSTSTDTDGESIKSSGKGSEIASIPDAPLSRGVRQMKLLAAKVQSNKIYLYVLYCGFAVLAFSLSLDQYTQSAYRTTATSVSFSAHSQLATLSTVKAIFQSISQPPIAALSNKLGRLETYLVCVFLYTLGYIIVSTCNSIVVYGIGASLNVLGITGLFLLQSIIIADISSLRNRLLLLILPSLPGTINVWVSGNVASAVIASGPLSRSWRLGFGIFCFATPILAIPVISTIFLGTRPLKIQSDSNAENSIVPEIKKEEQIEKKNFFQKASAIFWEMDVIGMILLVFGVGLTLVSVTLANSAGSKWGNARTIVMLTIGGSCCIGFILYERFGAKYPLMPLQLLGNRTVIACLLITVFHPAATSLASGYFYTFLVVADNQTVLSATRLVSIPSFVGTIVAIASGFVTRYTRRLKPLILLGFCIEVLGLGLMIRFRQGNSSQAVIGVVQAIRGVAIGMISFPVLTAIQSVAKPENLAIIISSYLTIFYLSGAIGSAISGAIWTNEVPKRLALSISNSTLASSAFANPIGFIVKYAPGTPERAALSIAQTEAQKIIVITATCFAAVAFFLTFGIEDIILPDSQDLSQVEKKEDMVVN